MKDYSQIISSLTDWTAPEIKGEILHGDMPGDKVSIESHHIEKANKVFKELLNQLPEVLKKNNNRAVLCVCGGSGVGKSEIASLLSHYFREAGIGSYTLSGDNYPYRIPMYNDAERLGVFRRSAIKAMVADESLTKERFELIQQFQKEETDASAEHAKEYEWYHTYLEGGKAGLKNYLGTPNEINFGEVEEIVSQFKQGADSIWLKRMGRDMTELWYEKVDMSEVGILVVEWTHGNSDNYKGVDIPVLLNSTPQETLAHRKASNRDGKTDSPFTMLVLELEQEMLERQACKAKVIVSKQGDLLSYEEYQALMKAAKENGNE